MISLSFLDQGSHKLYSVTNKIQFNLNTVVQAPRKSYRNGTHFYTSTNTNSNVPYNVPSAGGVGEASEGVGEASEGVGEASEGVGEGVGEASEGVGEASGGVGEASEGVGEASEGVGEGVGEASEGVGEGVGEASEGVVVVAVWAVRLIAEYRAWNIQ